MSSPAWLTPEAQDSTAQSQTAKSLVQGAAADSSTPAAASISPVRVSTTDVVTSVMSAPSVDAGSSTAVVVPASPSANPATPGAPHVPANHPLQDTVRAKFVTSPGFVVPAPSFSYSVFPRVNTASGSSQQSSSTSALKLTPPMPAAALQPPVPGQPYGNRLSFSYNVVPRANASSASGQQFQPATVSNQIQLQGVKFASPTTATSMQPPVPMQPARPSSTIPGTAVPNFQSVQLPLSIPKGQLPTSTNFSFGGSPKPATAEASEKQLSSNAGASNVVPPEAGATVSSVSSQSVKLSANMSTSSSSASTGSHLSNSSSMPMLTSPSFTVFPGMPVISGTPGLPGGPSSLATQPTASTSSSSTLRPVMPVPAVSSNLASGPLPPPQNAQQQIYPHYPSRPVMVPPLQAPWLHAPQVGGLQHPPFLPYPAVLPAPYPFPLRGGPHPSVSLANVYPPGVSTTMASDATTITESSHPGIKPVAGSLPPGIEHDKQTNDLHNDRGTTKNEEVDSWTAHKAESGAIYYYNSITGESTYDKPSSFKGEPEKVTAQPSSVSWEKFDGTNWALITTNDGKKYYYDSKNKVSSWQIPAEVVEMRKNQESDSSKGNTTQEENVGVIAEKASAPICMSTPAVQTGGRDSMILRTPGAQVPSSALDLVKKKLQDAGAPVTSSPLPASSNPATSDLNGSKTIDATAKGQQSMNSKDKAKDANGNGMTDSSSDSDDAESGPTKEECIIQFKEMLKERGVAPFSKWDKELPKIVFDPRFKAVPGYSARRSIFEHFVRTRAEEERKEKRAAQKAAIDGFKQLLEEASEDIDHKTDYQAFKRKWGNDLRFKALDRKERELLLNEKLLPLKKAAEDKIQAVRTAAVASFKSMLRENNDITTSSRWSKVKDGLRNDPRYKSVKHEEREVLFNEYISELKVAEDEAERSAKAKRDEQDKLKEREREMRKRKEREEQEMERVRTKVRRKEAISSYQALLVETIRDPKASWTESKAKLEKDPQGRATNPDLSEADTEKLFRDHVKDLYERCVRDFRYLLAEVITAEVAAQTTSDGKNVLNSWSEAKALIKNDPRYSKMPRKERESLWSRHTEELIRKQKSAADHPIDRVDREGRDRPSADYSRRSHGRR